MPVSYCKGNRDGLLGRFPAQQLLVQYSGKVNHNAQDYIAGYCDGMHARVKLLVSTAAQRK